MLRLTSTTSPTRAELTKLWKEKEKMLKNMKMSENTNNHNNKIED